jgi:PTH1 family peptidyl-tRNA hydrolase
MKLIVGLGNPGAEYENTRHNTGFLTLDCLAENLSVNVGRKAFQSLIGRTTVNGETVILMKPQTYMNLSGNAVGQAVRYYHLDSARDLLVIYDDLDLPVGKIRLRESGSSGGHNGIKSIIAALPTGERFCRIRIGTAAASRRDVIDFVLSAPSGDEKLAWQQAQVRAAEAAEAFLSEPFQKVMSRYNQETDERSV